MYNREYLQNTNYIEFSWNDRKAWKVVSELRKAAALAGQGVTSSPDIKKGLRLSRTMRGLTTFPLTTRQTELVSVTPHTLIQHTCTKCLIHFPRSSPSIPWLPSM